MLSACSGDAKTENGTKDIDMAGTQGPGSGEFPVLAEGRSAGTLTGTIADNSLDLDGVCATSESSFDFWSDGTDFASNRDVDGDGQYITVQSYNTGDTVMTALRFSKDGETVYNGQVTYDTFDGKTMSIDRDLGRKQAISADFMINCE